jgi:hypothetical protein
VNDYYLLNEQGEPAQPSLRGIKSPEQEKRTHLEIILLKCVLAARGVEGMATVRIEELSRFH